MERLGRVRRDALPALPDQSPHERRAAEAMAGPIHLTGTLLWRQRKQGREIPRSLSLLPFKPGNLLFEDAGEEL